MSYLLKAVIIISLLSSIIIHVRRPNPLYLKLFPLFLLVTIAVEFVAAWVLARTGNNVIVFNIYSIVNFCFYLFVLKEVIVRPVMKMSIKIALFLFLGWSICNLFYIQKVDSWNSMTYSIGCLLVVALSIYYFFELFIRPAFVDLKKEPSFWIISGIMFFYACSFPFLGLANFVSRSPQVLINNLTTILTLLSILMYVLFTIAFICRLKFARPELPRESKRLDNSR